jgi:hypothetical protein
MEGAWLPPTILNTRKITPRNLVRSKLQQASWNTKSFVVILKSANNSSLSLLRDIKLNKSRKICKIQGQVSTQTWRWFLTSSEKAVLQDWYCCAYTARRVAVFVHVEFCRRLCLHYPSPPIQTLFCCQWFISRWNLGTECLSIVMSSNIRFYCRQE